MWFAGVSAIEVVGAAVVVRALLLAPSRVGPLLLLWSLARLRFAGRFGSFLLPHTAGPSSYRHRPSTTGVQLHFPLRSGLAESPPGYHGTAWLNRRRVTAEWPRQIAPASRLPWPRPGPLVLARGCWLAAAFPLATAAPLPLHYELLRLCCCDTAAPFSKFLLCI